MNDTHYFRPREIAFGERPKSRRWPFRWRPNATAAYWAYEPSRQALLFVHGFGGHAVGTWNEFPSLLKADPRCSGRDLIFYGYDSVYQHARGSAIRLWEFLDRLFRDTPGLINQTLGPAEPQRGPDFEYDQLMVVAHSLGAVIVRQALLEARGQDAHWLPKIRFVLFAPADCGSNVDLLVSEALSGIPWVGPAIGVLFKREFTVVNDLTPRSPTLGNLLADTSAALATGTASYLLARRILFAEDESVTGHDRFVPAELGTAKVIPATTHQTICKPTHEWRSPITELGSIL